MTDIPFGPLVYFNIAPPVLANVPAAVTDKLSLLYAINATGKRALWDAAVAASDQNVRDYLAAKVTFPADSPKIKRLAVAAGLDLDALFAGPQQG